MVKNINRILMVAGLLCPFAQQAQAAKCYIREYSALGVALTNVAQVAQEPALTDQVTADFSSAAVQSSAFNSATSLVRLWCDTQASFLVGTNPTAANTNAPIAAFVTEYFGVPLGKGYKLSVHSNP